MIEHFDIFDMSQQPEVGAFDRPWATRPGWGAFIHQHQKRATKEEGEEAVGAVGAVGAVEI